MIASRKGIISMPVKLTVSFLIIALMVPPVVATVDDLKEDAKIQELSVIAEDLKDSISKTYSRGPDYTLWKSMEVPNGCRLELGGEAGRTIREFIGDRQVGSVVMSYPVSGEPVSIYGGVYLKLGNSDEGVTVAVV